MNNLKILLRNKIILAVLVGLLVLSFICVSIMSQGLKQIAWQEDLLNQYEWVIPLGMYNHVSVAELDGQIYFIASPEGKVNLDSAIYQVSSNGKLKAVKNMTRFLALADMYNYERLVHPAGYQLEHNFVASDWEFVIDAEENELTDTFARGSLMLTEAPGYVIDMLHHTVISLENGKVIYQAAPDERIAGQLGDYWLMEREIPWGHTKLPLQYLRNLDFSMALDGMLFDSVYEVENGKICGTVIISGTYDVLPDEVIEVEERIVEADGTWRKIFDGTQSGAILGAGDGYYVTYNHTSEETLVQFLDGTEPAVIDRTMEPFGACRDGILAFQLPENDGKKGFMNCRGEIIVEPIFSNCSTPHQGMAVVEYQGSVGVIRLKGGEAND